MATRTADQLAINLNSIRKVMDRETINDIELVKDKVVDLSCLAGLAAECQAGAKKRFEKARLIKLKELKDSGVSPSVLLKMAESECYEESALYEYSQRISAGLSHTMDSLRSVISLYKVELQNSLNGN